MAIINLTQEKIEGKIKRKKERKYRSWVCFHCYKKSAQLYDNLS